MKSIGPVKTVYPGHGPVGDAGLIDEAIHYMKVYQSYAKPGVPLPEIVEGMTQDFPDYDGEIILWWTRGPQLRDIRTAITRRAGTIAGTTAPTPGRAGPRLQ